MQNFDYQTPTRLIFGEGVVEKLQKADLRRRQYKENTGFQR